MTKWKYKHIDGYSGNLGGNYFTDGQITDYEPIVKKFPEWFEIFEEEKVENKDGIKLTIEQEDYLDPNTITFDLSKISEHNAINYVKELLEKRKPGNNEGSTSDPEAFEEYSRELLEEYNEQTIDLSELNKLKTCESSDHEAFEEHTKELLEEENYDGTPEITNEEFVEIETIECSKNELNNFVDEDVIEEENEEFVEPKPVVNTMPIIISDETIIKEKIVKTKKDDKKKTKSKK